MCVCVCVSGTVAGCVCVCVCVCVGGGGGARARVCVRVYVCLKPWRYIPTSVVQIAWEQTHKAGELEKSKFNDLLTEWS